MDEFTEVPVFGAAKRCGVRWAPWMGDWFTSWSPRNSNQACQCIHPTCTCGGGTWPCDEIRWLADAYGVLIEVAP